MFRGKSKDRFWQMVKILCVVGVAILIFLFIGIIRSHVINEMQPIIKDNTSVEYGQSTEEGRYGLKKLEISDFIINADEFDEIKLGKIDSNGDFKEMNINFDKVGLHEITLDLHFKNSIKKHTFTVNAIDSNYPTLEYPKTITTKVGELANLKGKIKAYDIVDGELEVTVKGLKKFEDKGMYKVQISAGDISGNTSYGIIDIEVQEKVINANQTMNNIKDSKSDPKPTLSKDKELINKEVETEIVDSDNVNKIDPVETREDPLKIALELEMIFYKDYLSSDACISEVYNLASSHWEDWGSSYCDDNGFLFYTKK